MEEKKQTSLEEILKMMGEMMPLCMSMMKSMGIGMDMMRSMMKGMMG